MAVIDPLNSGYRVHSVISSVSKSPLPKGRGSGRVLVPLNLVPCVIESWNIELVGTESRIAHTIAIACEDDVGPRLQK